MMVVSCQQMRALEERAFAEGATPQILMEQAGARIAAAVRQFFPARGRCVVFFGKGHNGGDALVAARHLAMAGWDVETNAAFGPGHWSVLTRQYFAALQAQLPRTGESVPLVVLDGLLGIGAGGPLREPIASAARAINQLRTTHNARVFAIDLPSGLNGDTGQADPDTVIADFTLAIGHAKCGLLADAATRFVGRLAIIPLPQLSAAADPADRVATPGSLHAAFPRRGFDVHKGSFGRIAVLAGSRGLTGAALMAAQACVHAGAGLVTLYVPEEIYLPVTAAACPEIMVRPVASFLEALDAKHDVFALGPGLGLSRCAEILELIGRVGQPMVIDADGLNALAASPAGLDTACAGPRLLTPHPGEMARLDPASTQRSRQATARAFTARSPHTLLLKGARTLVAERDHALSYNSTGSPGMASGGMGDVLTGVCAALAGQGLALYDAARLGAWLCGRAAELAIFAGSHSEESLSATVVLAHLGAAFKELRAEGF